MLGATNPSFGSVLFGPGLCKLSGHRDSDSEAAAAELMRQSTFPRSGVLVVGANYIQSLLPSTLRSQAESLLESHRIEDAIGLADQQRKKLESNLTVDDDEVCSITISRK